jgi:hypothetical protein
LYPAVDSPQNDKYPKGVRKSQHDIDDGRYNQSYSHKMLDVYPVRQKSVDEFANGIREKQGGTDDTVSSISKCNKK